MFLTKRAICLVVYLLSYSCAYSSKNETLDSLLIEYRKDTLRASSFLLNRIGSEYYLEFTHDGYNKALMFHQKALPIALKEKNIKDIAWTYRLIAAVYDATNMNLDTAALYYEHFLEFQLSTNDSLRIIDAYRNVMVINEKSGNKKAQFDYAEKMYAYLIHYYGKYRQAYKNQLSVFYAKNGNIKRAEALFEKTDIRKAIEEDIEDFRNYYLAGHFICQSQKREKEAIVMLNEVLGVANLAVDSVTILKFLSEHHLALGDYKNAFYTREQSAALENRLSLEADRIKIDQTVAFYQNEQKENERIYFKEKAESETKIKNYTFLALGLLILVVLVVIYFSNKTKEKNRLLSIEKEKVEKLNKLNQKIFSVISHDFNGPLMSVNILLDVLKSKDYQKEEIEEYFFDISNQISQSKQILENLLSWARAELRMEQPYSLQVHSNPFAIANEIGEQFKLNLESKKLTIINTIPVTLELNVLPDILKIIFRNLISNAIKFSFSSSSIEIGYDNTAKQIFVKDHGVGMDQKLANQLFKQAVGNTHGTANELALV